MLKMESGPDLSPELLAFIDRFDLLCTISTMGHGVAECWLPTFTPTFYLPDLLAFIVRFDVLCTISTMGHGVAEYWLPTFAPNFYLPATTSTTIALSNLPFRPRFALLLKENWSHPRITHPCSLGWWWREIWMLWVGLAVWVGGVVDLGVKCRSVAYDQSSAPKYCRVFGWLEGPQSLETDSNAENEKVLLAEFTYDLEKSNAQTYSVFDSATSAVIDTVRFEFSTNYGSPTHTCIYRVRVHGHDPSPVPKIA
ncbi:hypothetical protein KSS87_023699 [Heliosperma pusillum]|nr:hypothetical protein KSS87_023699 [Heliosperma pusillum]